MKHHLLQINKIPSQLHYTWHWANQYIAFQKIFLSCFYRQNINNCRYTQNSCPWLTLPLILYIYTVQLFVLLTLLPELWSFCIKVRLLCLNKLHTCICQYIHSNHMQLAATVAQWLKDPLRQCAEGHKFNPWPGHAKKLKHWHLLLPFFIAHLKDRIGLTGQFNLCFFVKSIWLSTVWYFSDLVLINTKSGLHPEQYNYAP